jgi:hypothetical protein
MNHYHPDATYEDASGLRRGHTEIRANYEEHVDAFPWLEVANGYSRVTFRLLRLGECVESRKDAIP